MRSGCCARQNGWARLIGPSVPRQLFRLLCTFRDVRVANILIYHGRQRSRIRRSSAEPSLCGLRGLWRSYAHEYARPPRGASHRLDFTCQRPTKCVFHPRGRRRFARRVLPGVTVLITHQESGNFRQVLSNVDGMYFVTGIVPGTYRIEAELPGFKKTRFALWRGRLRLSALGGRRSANRALTRDAVAEAESRVP
jgi:hypothetical protein